MKRLLSAVLLICMLASTMVFMPVSAASPSPFVLKEIKTDEQIVFYDQTGIVTVRDGKYGKVDFSGKEIIPYVYGHIGAFSDGVAPFMKDGKYGLIDKSGKIVVQSIYDSIYNFRDGFARIMKDGKHGIIDTKGKIIAEPIYSSIYLFRNGIIELGKDGKTGLVYALDGIIIQPLYDYVSSFRDGYAVIGNDGKYGVIDKTGKEVIQPTYEDVGAFYNGLAYFKKDGKYGFIDKTGKVVIQPTFDSVGSFSDDSGFATYGKDEKVGFIDKTGKIVITAKYDDVGYGGFSEGMIAFRKDGKYGFIDKSDKVIIPPTYDNVGWGFNDGLTRVGIGRKYGLINTSGKTIIQPIYDWVYNINEELVVIEQNEKYGLMNTSGNVIVSPRYSFIEDGSRCGLDDYFLVYSGSRWGGTFGIMDKKGNLLLPIEYQMDEYFYYEGDISALNEILVTKDGKYYSISLQKNATPLVAKPTASSVIVDGSSIAFDAYNISDNNYFKLRDLAFILNESSKQFEVSWDDVDKAIALTSGKAYTSVGGKMSAKGTSAKKPILSSVKIVLDGEVNVLNAYNIDGNNYFKLRDIGETFDFAVEWNEAENTIAIDTSNSYVKP